MTRPTFRTNLGTAEQTRLAALHALAVLDQPRRNDLDSLARLAAHICDAPMAAINLVDLERQWSAAAFGWEPPELPRDVSMCAVAIQSSDVSVTANAATDPRWENNPCTTGELASVRFYAAAPLIVDDGQILGTVCAFSDREQQLDRVQIERLRDVADLAVLLLELHDKAERLGAAALRDSLTGLPNRALFAQSLDRSLARAARDGHPPAVLFLDLNGFKDVNDTHGHAAGDGVLRVMAERLLQTVRGADVVARLGGDEFVVLCDQLGGDETDTGALSERIRRAFCEPIQMFVGLAQVEVRVGVSIGAIVGRGGESAEQIIARADAAMYADKRRSRNPLRSVAG